MVALSALAVCVTLLLLPQLAERRRITAASRAEDRFSSAQRLLNTTATVSSLTSYIVGDSGGAMRQRSAYAAAAARDLEQLNMQRRRELFHRRLIGWTRLALSGFGLLATITLVVVAVLGLVSPLWVVASVSAVFLGVGSGVWTGRLRRIQDSRYRLFREELTERAGDYLVTERNNAAGTADSVADAETDSVSATSRGTREGVDTDDEVESFIAELKSGESKNEDAWEGAEEQEPPVSEVAAKAEDTRIWTPVPLPEPRSVVTQRALQERQRFNDRGVENTGEFQVVNDEAPEDVAQAVNEGDLFEVKRYYRPTRARVAENGMTSRQVAANADFLFDVDTIIEHRRAQ